MNTFNKTIFFLGACFLLLISFSYNISAVKSTVNPPEKVKTFKTTNDSLNNVQITIKNTKITIKYHSTVVSNGYQIWLYANQSITTNGKKPLSDGRGYLLARIPEQSSTFDTIIDFNQQYDLSQPYRRNLTFVDNASYSIVIEKNTKNDLENTSVNNINKSEIAFNSIVLNITSTTKIPSILKYGDIIKNNEKIDSKNKYDPYFYKDKSLMDIRFVLRNPVTNTYMTMSPSKIAYIKKISDEIVRKSNAKTDYEKAQAIYKYVADNFYYDQVAFQEKKNQFANPYLNLYNLRNNKSSYNSIKSYKQAKVATTCQGYSAIYLSLVRAQNIPTRLIFGHRNSLPNRDWKNESNIKIRDHWWAQSYINKKWITIDPTIATSSIWKKDQNNSKKKVWEYYGLKNIVYFNPTKEQLASSHISHDVYKNNVFNYRISSVKISKQRLKNNKVKIKWSYPTQYKEKYTQYELYYKTSKNGEYKKLSTTKYRFYISKKLKKNRTYYFKVRPMKKVYNNTFKGQFSKVITHKV